MDGTSLPLPGVGHVFSHRGHLDLDNAMSKAKTLYEMCGMETEIHNHAAGEPCEGHQHWEVP